MAGWLIEVDARYGYHAQDIERLLARVDGGTIIMINHAHLLTTKAFERLYQFLAVENSKGLRVILASDHPEKIFPPILEYTCIAPRS